LPLLAPAAVAACQSSSMTWAASVMLTQLLLVKVVLSLDIATRSW
jgi:hypothetical protein